MDFSELEAIDGLRWAWNSWASSPVEAARMVIPLGLLCTPLMPLHDVPLLPYDPLLCNSCHAILNPYCRIDYHARLWICPFCHHRSAFPPSYASITENNLPAELFPTYSTVEYHLNRSSASIAASPASRFSTHQQMMQGAGVPGFVFVVDTCVATEDLQHLKNEILHVISQLPESAVVGLISFGDMVTVHDLSYTHCSRAVVFHGHRELSSTQVQDLFQISPQQLRQFGKTAVHYQGFLLPMSECEFNFTTALEELQPNSFPVLPDHRPCRATGAAIAVATGLLEGCLPNAGARIMVFVAGPTTIGPGIIVDADLGKNIRTHQDLVNGNASHYKTSCKFYKQLAQRLVAAGLVLDVFACSLDQVGTAEMKPAVESSGGLMMLAETFDSDQFKKCLQRLFACDEQGHLKMNFNATIDIITTKEVKICGALGPCSSLQKKATSVSEHEIGIGGTRAWKMSTLTNKTCLAFFFEVSRQQSGKIQPGTAFFIQFITQYQHGNGQVRLRVTTTARRWVDGTQLQELAAGFDQEAAAAIMARLVVHKSESEEIHEILRWLDRMLIRFASTFGQKRRQKILYTNTSKRQIRTLGVIYGDIGTSPLYVYTAIFPDPPEDNGDIVGACSLIIWSLTIVPLIKYIFIVLRADDNGQGGTFALYSLLYRYSGLNVHDEQRPDDLTIVNYETTSTHSVKESQNFIKRHKFVQNFLTVVVLFGASLIMSDGLLTPAISVISAVEGIAVPAPSTHGAIVYISSGILILLFMLQRFGTNKVGGLFAPIVFLWFVAIASIGIWNITFEPNILRAFNPYYIFDYFIRNKGVGFETLGGVLLAITGVEALYADLGHFNRIAVQLSFPLIVYPSLVLAYLGQAARLTLDNTLVSNTFYNTVPSNPFIYWSTFVLATLATIIASQAMISATFSLICQAMQLDSFPRVKIIHTSKKIEGQIYIPEINYILMVAIVIVCFAFQASARLTIAYGVAVASVMFITTILLSIVIHVVWGLPVIVSVVFFLIFGLVDVAFLSSTLLKVRNGGWFTLTFGVILACVMLIWRWGTNLKYQHELNSKSTFENIFVDPDDELSRPDDEKLVLESENDGNDEIIVRNSMSSSEPSTNLKRPKGDLQLSSSGFHVSRLPGIGMFYNGAGFGVPLTFKHFVQHFPAVPKTLIFISIRHLPIPYVGEDDRLVVKKVRYNGCYRVVARYGYMEDVSQGQEFIIKMIEEVRKIDPNNDDLLESSNPGKHVTYVLGRQSLQPKPNALYGKKALINFYVFLENISRQLYGNWNIPINDVVDVGMKIAV